nr:SGNH hydrolase domain-containing protein [Corynebacterium sp. TAE3-ERU12]
MGEEPYRTLHLNKDEGDDIGAPCVYGDVDGENTMLLLGGSHSEMWFDALDPIAKEKGWRLETIFRQGCPPITREQDLPGDVCAYWTKAVLEYLDDNPPDLIVVTSTRPVDDGPGDFVPDRYIRFWDQLRERNLPFVALRDTPWFFDAEDESYSPTECVVRGGDPRSCGKPRKEVLNDVDPAAEVLDGYPNGTALDMTDLFCPDDYCPAVIGNLYPYRDSNHVTVEYVRTVAKQMARELGPIMERAAIRKRSAD